MAGALALLSLCTVTGRCAAPLSCGKQAAVWVLTPWKRASGSETSPLLYRGSLYGKRDGDGGTDLDTRQRCFLLRTQPCCAPPAITKLCMGGGWGMEGIPLERLGILGWTGFQIV